MTEEAQIQEVTEEKNPFTEDLQRMYVGTLGDFLVYDRTEWTQEEYETALREAIAVKGLSQWAIGLLCYEIRKKWPVVTFEMIANKLGVGKATLESYTYTYMEFVKYRPDFIPPQEYSFEFLRVVANLAKKQGKDPAKELERLADKGITENSKAAYKDMKEEETGVVLPPLVKCRIAWDQYQQKQRFYLKGSIESGQTIDIPFLIDQLMEITGRKLKLTEEFDQ